MKRQHGIILAVATTLGLCWAEPAAAQAPQSGTVAAVAGADAAAFDAFHKAVLDYLSLERRLRSETPAFEVTPDVRKINNASDVLALAIQRARPRAKQGDFFDAAAARAVAARLRQALEGRDVVQLLAAINDEPTLKGPPRVYMRFPAASSMATMPTHLIDVLPKLPDELEFRFIGRYLVLRDRDAALILDYVAEALPAGTPPTRQQ